jgi:protein arginine N-methyltransferase 5
MMPGFRREEVTITRLGGSFMLSMQFFLTSYDVDEAEGIIAMTSEWLELDSDDAWVRHDAEIALDQELSYAAYLNIFTIILSPPRNREHVASYARAVSACLNKYPYISLSVRLPIYHPAVFQATQTQASYSATGSLGTDASTPVAVPTTPPAIVTNCARPASGTSLDATWEMWDVIRTMCEYNPRLTLSLS